MPSQNKITKKQNTTKELDSNERVNLNFTGSQRELLLLANNRDFLKTKVLSIISETDKLINLLNVWYYAKLEESTTREKAFALKVEKKFEKIGVLIYKIDDMNVNDKASKLMADFKTKYIERYNQAFKLYDEVRNDSLKVSKKKHEDFIDWKMVNGKKFSFMNIIGLIKNKDKTTYFRFRILNKIMEALVIDTLFIYNDLGILSESVFMILFVNMLTNNSMLVEKLYNPETLSDIDDYMHDMFGKTLPFYYEKLLTKLKKLSKNDKKLAQLVIKKNILRADV